MFCGKAVKPIYEFMSSFLFQFKLMMTWAQLLLFLFYSAICHHCDKFLPGEESLGLNIFHHISTHENISRCKNISLIINWCGGLVVCDSSQALTCMMKAGGEDVGSGCCCITRGLTTCGVTTPPLRLLRTGIPEL